MATCSKCDGRGVRLMRPDAHGPSMCTDCSGTGQAATSRCNLCGKPGEGIPDCLHDPALCGPREYAQAPAAPDALAADCRAMATACDTLGHRDCAYTLRQAAQRIEALQAVADAARDVLATVSSIPKSMLYSVSPRQVTALEAALAKLEEPSMTNIDYAALRVALAQAPDRPHTFYLAARTALPALRAALASIDETQRRIDAIRKLAAEAEHLLSCREAEARVEAESGAEYRPAAYSAYGALREAETLRAVIAILEGADGTPDPAKEERHVD